MERQGHFGPDDLKHKKDDEAEDAKKPSPAKKAEGAVKAKVPVMKKKGKK